jgi:hypothetical protein
MFNNCLTFLSNFFDFKFLFDFVMQITQTGTGWNGCGTFEKFENHSFIRLYNEIKAKFEIKQFKNLNLKSYGTNF